MASKKEERAFLRGEVGVDGQATEETQDEAQVEAAKSREALLRGRTWLGRECLTWLLWKSESTEAVLSLNGQDVTVVFHGKALLRAGAGDVTEASVKGVTAPGKTPTPVKRVGSPRAVAGLMKVACSGGSTPLV